MNVLQRVRTAHRWARSRLLISAVPIVDTCWHLFTKKSIYWFFFPCWRRSGSATSRSPQQSIERSPSHWTETVSGLSRMYRGRPGGGAPLRATFPLKNEGIQRALILICVSKSASFGLFPIIKCCPALLVVLRQGSASHWRFGSYCV